MLLGLLLFAAVELALGCCRVGRGWASVAALVAAAVKGTSLVPFSKIAFFHVDGHKFRIAEDTIKTANGGNSRRSTPPLILMNSRVKDHPSNVPGNVGTAIILSFLDLDNSFSPFDKNEPSEAHYKSNSLFQKISFQNWFMVAKRLKKIACLLIPNDPHYVQETANISPGSPGSPCSLRSLMSLDSDSDEENNAVPVENNQVFTSPQRKTPKKPVPSAATTRMSNPACIVVPTAAKCSIDDIFWAMYPNKAIFMRIDLVGDVFDVTAHKISISTCGTIVSYSSRIPEMMLDAKKILKNCHVTNAWLHLMDSEIQKRKENVAEDHFEIKKTARLPYPVQQKYYDENFAEADTYEITVTDDGAAYACFWLLPVGFQKSI